MEEETRKHKPPYTAIRGKPSSYSYTDEELVGGFRRKMEEVIHPGPVFGPGHIQTFAQVQARMDAPKKDAVNPDHYKKYTVEVIDMMERIYGTASTATHCELSALKYTLRSGFKDDAIQDLKKRDWYLAKASELRAKIGTDKEIIHDNK